MYDGSDAKDDAAVEAAVAAYSQQGAERHSTVLMTIIRDEAKQHEGDVDYRRLLEDITEEYEVFYPVALRNIKEARSRERLEVESREPGSVLLPGLSDEREAKTVARDVWRRPRGGEGGSEAAAATASSCSRPGRSCALACDSRGRGKGARPAREQAEDQNADTDDEADEDQVREWVGRFAKRQSLPAKRRHARKERSKARRHWGGF